jgi:hypothetical protein
MGLQQLVIFFKQVLRQGSPEPVEGQLLRVDQNWIPDQKRHGNDIFSVQRKISANQVKLFL